MASLRSGAALVLLCSLAACTQLKPRPELPVDRTIPVGKSAHLDRIFAPAEAQNAGESAFRLLIDGIEAFVIRSESARVAERSVDVQTYIWHADQTGLFLAYRLLECADRGVKVRLLLDDMDARAKNAGFAAISAHPNIDVRLFNPFAARTGAFAFIGEALTSFGRINRRMHNKTWIADNRIAIAGGRNLGDEYFHASDEVNFVDLDFAMVGPVVRDASASFDRYWNSPSAYPIEVLDPEAVTEAGLGKLRTVLLDSAREIDRSAYATAVRGDAGINRLRNGEWPMQWSGRYQFVSDDPLKVTMKQKDAQRTRVGAALAPMVKSMQRTTAIISPYFVPGKETTDWLANAARGGKNVRILTNSLVANDVAAVHGGYSRYRKPLVEGGVHLWELKPLGGGDANSSMFGSSGASLHTKGLSVDEHQLFVGSYNLDPRSTWLNCEQGVLVENETLVSQFEAIFATQTSGERAWKVSLDGKDLRWTDGNATFDSDPKATAGRRFQAWLTRVLRLDAQL